MRTRSKKAQFIVNGAVRQIRNEGEVRQSEFVSKVLSELATNCIKQFNRELLEMERGK